MPRIYLTEHNILPLFYVGQDLNDDPDYYGSGKLLNDLMNKKYNGEILVQEEKFFSPEIYEEIKELFYENPDCFSKENWTNSTLEFVPLSAYNLLINPREKYWVCVLSANNRFIGGLNMTEGGDGSIGFKHSEETKEKMKIKRKLQIFTEETKQKMSESATKYYQEHPEVKQQKSKLIKGEKNHNFGKPKTKEIIEKQKKSMQKYTYRLISPEGIVYDNINNLYQFSKEHNLNNGHMNMVVNGKEKQYKGWTGNAVRNIIGAKINVKRYS